MSWKTLEQGCRYEQVIKGSRFLAVCTPLASSGEAQAFISELRNDYPGASHVCSAFRWDGGAGFDDDGEPGGTAGRPMLEVLMKRDVERVAVACVRWFGGTKLGAGGLVRAYAGTVAKALDLGTIVTVHATTRLDVSVPFALADVAHRTVAAWSESHGTETHFSEHGVQLRTTVRSDAVPYVREALRESTRNEAQVVEVEDA